METVIVREIVDSAIRIATRLALGEFIVRGPGNNVLELESRVAWATVATELHKEAFTMVPPGEFAAVSGLTLAAVSEMSEKDGTLFALVYESAGKSFMLVPLAKREPRELLGPIPK